MRVGRTQTFQGLENRFPAELRPAILELVRRVEMEFLSLYGILQNSWSTTRDSEAVLCLPTGERLYTLRDDGAIIPLEVDFGQDQN